MKRFILLLLLLLLIPVNAYGITRSEVVNRGQSWVDNNIMYSQSKYYDGYRQDCSGFVSMCWELDDSYTTRTIDNVSNEISLDELRIGDAVWTPGHIVIFVRWVDDSHTSFVVLEESTWGRPALRREKNITSSSKGYRYIGIEEDIIPLNIKRIL